MNMHHKVLVEAIQRGIVDADTTTVGVMDFDGLAATVDSLQRAFSPNFHHTFAVKANSLRGVLIKLKSTDIGAEVASPGELELAISAGFTADEIIFDSPAKTRSDLRRCLRNGISVNLDNEQELYRVDALIKEFPDTRSVIGFRVNPQIGAGRISSTSTATKTSKFGYPLADGDNREKLLKIYAERPWLTSIHTHSGS
jgi:diaminopimelate decarboxylase